LRLRPADDFVKIGHQMHNRALAAGIVQLRMVPTMEQVQHDRPRAKVERHILSDLCARMAIDLKLIEAPRFNSRVID
jgi:hypothetical protein